MIESIITIVILLIAAIICSIRCPRQDHNKLARLRNAGF